MLFLMPNQRQITEGNSSCDEQLIIKCQNLWQMHIPSPNPSDKMIHKTYNSVMLIAYGAGLVIKRLQFRLSSIHSNVATLAKSFIRMPLHHRFAKQTSLFHCFIKLLLSFTLFLIFRSILCEYFLPKCEKIWSRISNHL